MARVLVIEDNDTLREGVVQVLRRMGHEVQAASDGLEGVSRFEEQGADLVITDLKMDGLDGMEVLGRIAARDREVPVILMTAFGSIEKAVEAMQQGAFDFVPKPFPPDLLRTKVARALEMREQRRRNERLESENAMLRAEVREHAGEPDLEIVGSSSAMAHVFELVRRVAPTDSTVYVHGESGTGKELVARAIHMASRCKDGPFVKVNCSALAEGLLESELFGHEKGSYTGAHKRRLGRFELADGGTLFLDEIGDISPSIQLKLLRVLQERRFERVGGEQTVSVDVRLVTATHKDIQEEVRAGRFREDLYYRLHVIPLKLPPLRERREDVAALAQHFLQKLSQRTRSRARGIDPRALVALEAYHWPGNVRELENVIEHALVFADGPDVGLGDLPQVVSGAVPMARAAALPQVSEDRPLPEVLDALEKQLIVQAWERAQGVKTETARLLGIKPSALYYKLEKYGIEGAPASEAPEK